MTIRNTENHLSSHRQAHGHLHCRARSAPIKVGGRSNCSTNTSSHSSRPSLKSSAKPSPASPGSCCLPQCRTGETRATTSTEGVEILNHLRDADGQIPVPEPFRKLAAIQPLRLLPHHHAILFSPTRSARRPTTLAYAPNSNLAHIPRDYAHSQRRIVFHYLAEFPESRIALRSRRRRSNSSGNFTKNRCPGASPIFRRTAYEAPAPDR